MRVLIVEDEEDLVGALQRALVEEGYACDVAHDGRSGLLKAQSWEYDAIVLDLMLPGLDGGAVLAQLRERRPTPVLVLTARDGVGEKVALLDAGADDYLTKPFELDELLARLRALIRRASREPRPALELGDVRIDTVAREVTRAGRPVPLSPKEYSLVEYLALHRGELVSRERICEHLYDESARTLSNVVDVYISNIRKHLGREFVRTRRGEGYVVDA
jgi:two-component system, OmpR family, response regulator